MEKKQVLTRWLLTVVVCLAVLLVVSIVTGYWQKGPAETGVIKVGFVYSEDESTPYTANFVRAQRVLEEQYGDQVEVLFRSNVLSSDAERPMQELIREGCRILFINLDTEIPAILAREYPDVVFCHISMPDVSIEGTPDNYHTFNGEIYQARYVSGIAAGMKLQELLEQNNQLDPASGLVGFVGANSTAEVVSGYTAFLLGVRTIVPDATMRVRYTGSWGNYDAERQATEQLISEGCIIIAQHVNTSAPANVCQEATKNGNPVYHVGYHESMLDTALDCALVSIRTNWVPYVTEAVQAVLNGDVIENAVKGHVHGRDMSAGFDYGWVELLDLNQFIVPEGTKEKVEQAIDDLKKGKVKVFSGDYHGVNPKNHADTIDLNEEEYIENEHSSNPTFSYRLEDCIMIEEE
ncbi:MAG: BMP family ABC transporter substrate-binding protein [Clostridia bacterium]|nr:BMP family ABC transporter substrate-binding protein [Clostridia bacterium]